MSATVENSLQRKQKERKRRLQRGLRVKFWSSGFMVPGSGSAFAGNPGLNFLSRCKKDTKTKGIFR